MRLKPAHIEKIALKIWQKLDTSQTIKARASEKQIRERIIRAIQDDLDAEVKLDEAARKMLEPYREQIESGQVDERKMFNMIKKQLAKERNIVL